MKRFYAQYKESWADDWKFLTTFGYYTEKDAYEVIRESMREDAYEEMAGEYIYRVVREDEL